MMENNYHAPLYDQTRRTAHNNIRAGYAARIDREQALRFQTFWSGGQVQLVQSIGFRRLCCRRFLAA